jgi:drug/metabolite transporter (DMT)-like permease
MTQWMHFAVWAVAGLAAYKTLIKYISGVAAPVLIMTIVSFFYFLSWLTVLLTLHLDRVAFQKVAFDTRNLVLVLGLAVAFFVSDYFLLRSYLAGAKLSVMTVLMGLSMVVVVLLGFILFREKLTILQVLGAALGVVSFALLSLSEKAS